MTKSYFVYILKCSDGTYYTGSTSNLEKRINEHKLGKYDGYTSKRLPIKLVYSQELKDPKEMIESERRIKKWSRLKKEALIDRNYDELVRLSNSK